MICPKCSADNSSEDRFCYKCGAPLAAGAKRTAANEIDPGDYATMNATTMLAAREARLTDVRRMRPLTQAAYNLTESEHASTWSTLISVAYVVLALGMVAVLIKVFETINKFAQSLAASKIEGSLSEQFYGVAAADNAQLLGWLAVLFAAMVVGFVVCGKLRLRLTKVGRKKRKENLDSRL